MKKILTIVLGLILICTFTSCGQKSDKEVSKAVEQMISDKYAAAGHNFYCPNGLGLKKTSGGDFLDNLFGTGRSEYQGIAICHIDAQQVEIVVKAVVENGKIQFNFGPSERQRQIDANIRAEQWNQQVQQWERQQQEETQRAFEQTQIDMQNYLNSQRDMNVEREVQDYLNSSQYY